MDRSVQLLSAVTSFPKGICTCCLVESCGLKHSYVSHLCNQLRNDGKLKPLDMDFVRLHLGPKGRGHVPEERCSVCGKECPYGVVFYPIGGQEVRALPTKDEPSFDWQEMGLAEKICDELRNCDKFECVGSAWLNAQRSIIIRLLNKIVPQKSGEQLDLRHQIEEGKKAGTLPAKVASYMQMLLTFRNSATYEDRLLDLAESLIARIAADEVIGWQNQASQRKK
jgi:hypothetical protein